MFKKSNRNFRTKKSGFDSDEDDSIEDKSEQDESKINSDFNTQSLAKFSQSQQSQQEKETVTAKKFDNSSSKKTQKSSTNLNHAVLSFNHDETIDDNEPTAEFRVKKSKESRRIAKELRKTKKERERQLKNNYNHENGSNVAQKSSKTEPILTSDEILFNEGIKVKPLNIASMNRKQQTKYLVNKYASETGDKYNEDAFDDYQRENVSEKRIKSDSDSHSSSESSSSEKEPNENKLQVR
jgi:hypothetical protein